MRKTMAMLVAALALAGCAPGGQYPMVSGFGANEPYRRGFRHQGVDWKAPVGTTVYAVASGTVFVRDIIGSAGDLSYGTRVDLYSLEGPTYVYQHLMRAVVEDNQEVVAGQPLGEVGPVRGRGRNRGHIPHLHFEVIDGKHVDPLPRIRRGVIPHPLVRPTDDP